MNENPSDEITSEQTEISGSAGTDAHTQQVSPYVDALLAAQQAAVSSGRVDYVTNAMRAVEEALAERDRRWMHQHHADALVEKIGDTVDELVNFVQDNLFLAEHVRERLGTVPLTGLGLLFGNLSANDRELPLEFLRAATEERLLAVNQESFDAICAALAGCRTAVEAELAKKSVPGSEEPVLRSLVEQTNSEVKEYVRRNDCLPSPETVAAWAGDFATMARREIFKVRVQAAAHALKADSSEQNLAAALEVYQSIEDLEVPEDWDALRSVWSTQTAGGKSTLPLLEYVARNERAVHGAAGLGELLNHQQAGLPPEASVLRYAVLGRTWRILLIRQPDTQRHWVTVLKFTERLPALLGIRTEDPGYRAAVVALADFASEEGVNDFVEAHRLYKEKLLRSPGEDA